MGYFLKQLDYSIHNQQERIKLVENILYKDGIKLENFFLEYFNPDRKPRPYFNYSPNSGSSAIHSPYGCLSEEDSVCRGLEIITNYILFSPDGGKLTKKNTTYNFVTREYMDLKLRKEKNMSKIVDENRKKAGLDNLSDDEIIEFVMVKENYKHEIKQKIFKRDLVDPELSAIAEYEQYKTLLMKRSNVLKNIKEPTDDERKEKSAIINAMGELKYDQIYLKDLLKGTIYFKNAMGSGSDYDWDLFDFFNEDHVMALLKVKRQTLIGDLGLLIYDMDKMLKLANLNSIETNILREYRYRDKTFTKIANEMGVKRHYVASVIKRIAKKVINVYEDLYEDSYYLHYVKGKYKRCSKCGEIKIANERHFSPDKRNIDGFQSFCKDCNAERMRVTAK